MPSVEPIIHHLPSVDTVMNAARLFLAQGELPVWASVISDVQTAGRGQYGRHWISPKGNIYACLRLPYVAPFTDTRCAIAVSGLIAAKLELLGVRSAIKWPNDIVVHCNGSWHKAAGILIEQKGSNLLAGIGINVAIAPSVKEMREGAALAAACLKDCGLQTTAPTLWHAIACYCQNLDLQAFAINWQHFVEKRLLWRGQEVVITQNGNQTTGVLQGLGHAGELLLSCQGELRTFTAGSVHAK